MSAVFDSVLLQLPRDAHLLARFYTELMQPNFPIADELAPFHAWVDQLHGFERRDAALTALTGVSNNQSICPSFCQSNNPSNQSSNPSINQSSKQPNSQTTNQSTNQQSTSCDSRTSTSSSRRCMLNILLAFAADDTERKHILGGIVFEYFARSNCALIAYLVIDPSNRGKGLTIILTIKAWEILQSLSTTHSEFDMPHVVFCEVNNPSRISESEDAFNPLTRIKAFQNVGVRLVADFPYIQPSLGSSPAKEYPHELLLAAVVGPMTERDEHDNPFIQTKHLKEFLFDFYSELQVKNHAQNADFLTMMRALEGRDRVQLVDFDLTKYSPPKSMCSKRPGCVSRVVSTVPAPMFTSSRLPIKVLVIGAGLSGLACARTLQKFGFAVTVLESRHRVGGRAYTGRIFDTRVDLGASWLHGITGNPLYEYCKSSMNDVRLHHSGESVQVIRQDGSLIDVSVVDQVQNHLMNALQQVRSKAASGESLSDAVHRVLSFTNEFQSVDERTVVSHLLSNIEGFQNTDLTKLDAAFFETPVEYSGGDHLVVDGYHNIALHLASSLNIRFNSQVTNVEYSQDRSKPVKVSISDGTYVECDYCVVTVPLGVLQSNRITFNPPLPDAKLAAMSRVGMGLLNKVVMQFDRVFWDESVDWISLPLWGNHTVCSGENANSFSHHSAVSVMNCWPVYHKPILVFFLFGDFARQLEKQSDRAIRENLLDHLRVRFGSSLRQPLDVVVTRWGADQHSCGSYSYPGLGCRAADFDALASSVADRVYFAGEHTSAARFGFADGAYASGLREAQRVIEQYHRGASIQSKL